MSISKLSKNLWIDHQSQRYEQSCISISQREKEVLKYMASGFTSSEIANDLFISEHTVTSHRKSLMIKLDAKNSAHLVLRSVRFGLLE